MLAIPLLRRNATVKPVPDAVEVFTIILLRKLSAAVVFVVLAVWNMPVVAKFAPVEVALI